MGTRKPPGRKKGTPKTGGRKKGTPNKATIAGRQFFRSITEDPEYQDTFRKRALAGILAPALEALMHHYSHGKPKDTVELMGKDGQPIEERKELIVRFIESEPKPQ